jgi:3-phosphoinositide dependent protein kinase-1
LNERRGTFVGTAYYVSPEMLKDNIALPASDLWALGCIIFKMLTGDVPFNGATDYKTFQMILERDLKFPDGMSDSARDLIDRLLQKEP